MGRNKGVCLALTALMSGILLFSGLWSPAPASALARVSALTSPNITTSFTGNLGTIEITGMVMSPGQSDDIIVSLPGGITLEPWQSGQSIDAFVSVSQYNPDGTGQNAFFAGPDNGTASVVANAYVSNPQITANMINFRVTAVPSSPVFSDVGSIYIKLPVVSVAGAAPGPINVTVWDTDYMILRNSTSSGILVNTSVPQLDIQTNSLPAATVGQDYDTTIVTNDGGTPPYTFSVSSGQPPPGLMLSPTDGTISGTPSSAGSYTFTVTVKDVTVYAASQSYTLVVNPVVLTVPPIQPLKPTGFSDIDQSWAKNEILHLTEAGVVTGYPDGTFRPNDPVTRAQFAKMLCLAADYKPVQDTSVLTRYLDHASFQSWELPWLAAAVDDHFLSGYPDGTLRPDQAVTRLEAAVMLGKTVTGVTPAPLTFADRDAIPAWAANYVELDLAQARGQNLFGSPPAWYFTPGQALTRAGAAAGLAVYLGL